MTMKTVPFSARISVEDAEFISTLAYDGAHTPSDKLRALLAETRRRHACFDDFSENLVQMNDWCKQISQPLLVRQQQLQIRTEASNRLLERLPELLASLQTLGARCPGLNVRELQLAEQQLTQQVLNMVSLLLPLAVTQPQMTAEQDGIFKLAELITQHRLAVQGAE
ncbi:hypothetical protein [Arsukibacterium sp.]|uniref:hypothetical protein n=1 Tax=Arsukibacterium sp. TaxID=1977258 RepID=UPI002FD8ACAC